MSKPYEHSVYIEDTDAMGVMLNSEYPRQMERALPAGDKVFGCKALKYLKPAELGDKLKWTAASGRKAGTFKVTCEREGDEVAIFIATGVVSTALQDGDVSGGVPDTPHSSSFVVIGDELCAFTGQLHTRTVFNLFERGRTDILGGGKGLKTMMNASSGIESVVVARVSDYRLSQHRVQSGQALSVRTQVNNMGVMVDFQQFICGEDGRLLARATVTCMALSPEGTPVTLEL